MAGTYMYSVYTEICLHKGQGLPVQSDLNYLNPFV